MTCLLQACADAVDDGESAGNGLGDGGVAADHTVAIEQRFDQAERPLRRPHPVDGRSGPAASHAGVGHVHRSRRQ